MSIRRCMILLAAAFVFLVVMALLRIYEKRLSFPENEEMPQLGESVVLHDTEYVLRKNVETMLVIGVDSYDKDDDDDSYYNTQRSDFLMLLVIDKSAETCSALHIDRDTIADVQRLGVAGDVIGVGKEQLALAHAYGSGGHDSCRNTLRAVTSYLGVPISHYMSLTMSAVEILNDALGGVTVTVLDDMSMIDEALTEGSEVTLMGEQALLYVRARSSLENPTNRRRMERQRQYLNALYQKFLQRAKSDDSFATNTLLKISDHMLSDCSASRLTNLFEMASEYEFLGISAIEGESVEGERFMEFYADEESLHDLIIELFYEPAD